MAATNPTKVLIRMVLVIGLLMSVSDCLKPLHGSGNKKAGRRDRFKNNRRPKPAHTPGPVNFYHGDIILPSTYGQSRLSLTAHESLWPNATVPYYFTNGSFTPDQILYIEDAMKVFHNTTCVRFVPRTPESPDYVRITNKDDTCGGSQGRQSDNANNVINLATPDCIWTANIIHEMMHVLGFLHEMSRPDRDEYISINRSALWPKYQTDEFFNAAFMKKETDVETYNIPYDYGSIMHYRNDGLGADPRYPVLKNLKPYDQPDFSNDTLSPSDIKAIQLRYCRNKA